jgi:hypothetical protein
LIVKPGRPREGFTEGFQDDSGTVVTETRFINYVGWPYTRALTAGQIADGFGVTRYVRVRWPEEDDASDKDPLAIADAATYTRGAIARGGVTDTDGNSVPKPTGLIALGGKVTDFAGFVPGVAEEIALAMEHGIGVYVLGGFGGAAEQVAAVMAGSRSDALTADKFMISPRYQSIHEAAKSKGRVDELTRRLKWILDTLRFKDLHNGLTKKQNEVLWSTENVGQAIDLVTAGLKRVSQSNNDVGARGKAGGLIRR